MIGYIIFLRFFLSNRESLRNPQHISCGVKVRFIHVNFCLKVRIWSVLHKSRCIKTHFFILIFSKIKSVISLETS